MLIPSIDLQGGRIVQLVQGEKLAIETTDIEAWIERLRGQPKVQLIDLDAAKGVGRNEALVARICGELPCRVGGGIRTPARAKEVLALGATKVIVELGALHGDRRRSGDGRGDARRRRHRAADCRRRQPRRRRRHSRLADQAVADGGGGRAAPRAVCRRVPLHARRPRRDDAGHGHGRHRRRPAGNHAGV